MPMSPYTDIPVEHMRARAAEIRQMAQTATTEETRIALLALADRFVALADEHSVDLGGPSCR